MTTTRRGFVAGAAALALAPVASAQPSRSPNVVLIVVDTLRADYVAAYGGRAHTPAIDSLARRGLMFTGFYPEAMATVPARRSIMTGRRVFPFRDWRVWPELMSTPGWAPIADPSATFTSALRRAGYWTGYVTDNPFVGYSAPFARFRRSFDRFARVGGQVRTPKRASTVSEAELRHWLAPELRQPHLRGRMRGYLAGGHSYWRDEWRSFAARVSLTAMGALDEAVASGRPFALVLDTFEPHEPWTPPESYIRLYARGRWRGGEPSMGRYAEVRRWLSRGRAGPVLERMRDLYAAEVTMTDRWLGLFLEHLRGRGLEGNTAIALVSDHGYLLGDHGWTGKIASILHPPLIHVPFILVDPGGRRAGGRTDYLAQTHDIGPTLLSLAGVRAPREMNGTDLTPLLDGSRPPERRLAYGGYANWHYARTRRWAYVAANNGAGRRLYDLRRDPDERRDVAGRHPRVVDEIEAAVLRRTGGRPPVYRV
jgi:arylsulfatase A-like enzyme